MNRRGVIVGAGLALATGAHAQQLRRAGFPPSYRVGVFSPLVAAGVSVWNPADKAAAITLSNSNRTASASSGPAGVRGGSGKASGKWYYEVTVTVANTTSVGVATTAYSLSSTLGADAGGAGYQSGGGVFLNNSFFTGAAYATGDVIGVAVDAGTGSVWFAKNNTWQSGNPSTGSSPSVTLSGTVYQAGSDGASGDVLTINATNSFTPPTGFSVWA